LNFTHLFSFFLYALVCYQPTSVWGFTADGVPVLAVCGLLSTELSSCRRPAEPRVDVKKPAEDTRRRRGARQPGGDPRRFTSGSRRSLVLRAGLGAYNGPRKGTKGSHLKPVVPRGQRRAFSKQQVNGEEHQMTSLCSRSFPPPPVMIQWCTRHSI